jgi:hypothetical protein
VNYRNGVVFIYKNIQCFTFLRSVILLVS